VILLLRIPKLAFLGFKFAPKNFSKNTRLKEGKTRRAGIIETKIFLSTSA
jgi:hypothetical protein